MTDPAPIALVKVIKRRWYWLIPGILASFIVPAVVSERVADPPPVVEAAPCAGTPLQKELCRRGRMYALIVAINQNRTNAESQISQRCMNQWVNYGWANTLPQTWAINAWYMVSCW